MKKKITGFIALVLSITMCLCGCGSENVTPATTSKNAPVTTPVAENNSTADNSASENSASDNSTSDNSVSDNTEQDIDYDRYIELAVNVYYNDASKNYAKNEASKNSVIIYKEGQYTLSFDCSSDLSNEAKAQGVSSLTNLTAIYLIDMGVARGNQSALKQCNIKYDEVIIDGVKLTVTQTEPKSAFKSSGVFDTNDPVNAWDGSSVLEVETTGDHVVNFTGVKDPKTISVTFTLSDFVWEEKKTETEVVVEGSGYTNPSVFSKLDYTNMDALTLTKYLGNGINLGNTMEAFGRTNLGTKARVSSYETFWGQPVTTAAMVRGMKDCGFDTLRIPIAWTNMMNYENGDYTIAEAYLNRVEEIVNYALEAEMFVIINDHWDGGWWAMFGSSNKDTVDNAWKLYTGMWSQIAERFKDYSEMLIFESANEELGNSLNSNSDWPDSGALSEDGKYEMTNAINQRFVDTIRSSGGKNATRFLLIAGFNTDFDKTLDDRYKMPKDSADKKLLLSVHYYSPWNYAGASTQAKWGIKSDYEYMNSQFEKLTKFTKQGYGIIIGEYGALPLYDSSTKEHTLKLNTVEYTTNILDNCDIYNYCPLLWSCNDFYNRSTQTMISEELKELFISRSFAKEQEKGDSYLKEVKASMKQNATEALDMWEGVETYETGTPVAWIMWNGGAGTYSVGDVFNPADNTAGIKATNVIIDGAGDYEVSLDFEGGNTGVTFSALAIADGELLYPNAVIVIKEILLDGKSATLSGTPYTCSDDGKCMRVNLYNAWVTAVPKEARSLFGLSKATPTPLDPKEVTGVKNITVKFKLIVK